MTIERLGVAALLLTCTTVCVAQDPQPIVGCYRFGPPAMTIVLTNGGRDSTNILRLFADSAKSPPSRTGLPAYRVEPVPFSATLMRREGYVRNSLWYFVKPDSLYVAFRNGLSGPVFRVAIRGDSLVGTQYMSTDYITGTPPPVTAAMAKRVACPK